MNSFSLDGYYIYYMTKKNINFSIIFKHIDKAKGSIEFQCVEETMKEFDVISPEIEKIREIVMDYDQRSFSIITTV